MSKWLAFDGTEVSLNELEVDTLSMSMFDVDKMILQKILLILEDTAHQHIPYISI